jgi:hypothetical protein
LPTLVLPYFDRVGLTDAVLVPLREKFLEKINQEDYENALKIQ